jgi:hypothetical protein
MLGKALFKIVELIQILLVYLQSVGIPWQFQHPIPPPTDKCKFA